MSAVREAFQEQAKWCRQLGSPFTARLCEVLAALGNDTDVGREILDWRGDPFAKADALPLRVAGALHALARDGRVPALTALYPPAPIPEAPTLWRACRDAFARYPDHFREYLAVAPQTNEVGRSAVLIAGMLVFAQRFPVPVHLLEIGASAGLNLIPDRFRYRFGSATWGDAGSSLELAPEWTGNPPPVDADLRVASRQGSDIAPLDLSQPGQRARLLSFVWPDQAERLQRLIIAIEYALVSPTPIEAMEAAEWVEQRLPPADAALAGGRLLFHSVFWRYLPAATRARIEARVAACGATATSRRPFGWLRLELEDNGSLASLWLTCWPGGEHQLVARAQPHGRSVTYLL